MTATALPWHVLRFFESKGKLVEAPSLALLLPLIKTMIDRDPTSSAVRDSLSAHAATWWGQALSHRKANRLLKEMIDEGLLYRVEHDGCMFFAHDRARTLESVVAPS